MDNQNISIKKGVKESILNSSLQGKIEGQNKDTLMQLLSNHNFHIVERFSFDGKRLILYKCEINGVNKYCLQNENVIVKPTDFILDRIEDIININGKIYYMGIKGTKKSYFEFNNENFNTIYFDEVRGIIQIDGKIFYKAKNGGKLGIIQFGNENNHLKSLIFDSIISGPFESNGEVYYCASNGNLQGLIIVGNEFESNERILFNKISYITEYKGKVFFVGCLNNYYGLFTSGKEHIQIDTYLTMNLIRDIYYKKSELGDKDNHGKIYFESYFGAEKVELEIDENRYDKFISISNYFKLKPKIIKDRLNNMIKIINGNVPFFSDGDREYGLDSLQIKNPNMGDDKLESNLFDQQVQFILDKFKNHIETNFQFNDNYLLKGTIKFIKPENVLFIDWIVFLMINKVNLEIDVDGYNYYDLLELIQKYETIFNNSFANINNLTELQKIDVIIHHFEDFFSNVLTYDLLEKLFIENDFSQSNEMMNYLFSISILNKKFKIIYLKQKIRKIDNLNTILKILDVNNLSFEDVWEFISVSVKEKYLQIFKNILNIKDMDKRLKNFETFPGINKILPQNSILIIKLLLSGNIDFYNNYSLELLLNIFEKPYEKYIFGDILSKKIQLVKIFENDYESKSLELILKEVDEFELLECEILLGSFLNKFEILKNDILNYKGADNCFNMYNNLFKLLPVLFKFSNYGLIDLIDSDYDKNNFISFCEKIFEKFFLNNFITNFGNIISKIKHLRNEYRIKLNSKEYTFEVNKKYKKDKIKDFSNSGVNMKEELIDHFLNYVVIKTSSKNKSPNYLEYSNESDSKKRLLSKKDIDRNNEKTLLSEGFSEEDFDIDVKNLHISSLNVYKRHYINPELYVDQFGKQNINFEYIKFIIIELNKLFINHIPSIYDSNLSGLFADFFSIFYFDLDV